MIPTKPADKKLSEAKPARKNEVTQKIVEPQKEETGQKIVPSHPEIPTE